MNDYLISIIIPIYNIESYLPTCIESVLMQTYTSFELLLIDDGSKDRSGEICVKYAAQDPRIQVFHKANGGVSSARNFGIEKATGEWITFIDGDDVLSNKEALYQAGQLLNKNIEWYIFDSKLVGANGEVLLLKYRFNDELDGKVIKALDLYSKFAYSRGSVWGCIYSRSFLNKYNIRFLEGVKNSEDDLFVKTVQHRASHVALKHVDFYTVNEREGSASRSWTNKRLTCYIDNLEKFETEISDKGIDYANTPLFNAFIFGYIYQMIDNAVDIGNKTNYRNIVRVLRKSKLYPIATTGIKNKGLSKRIKLLNFSVRLYILFILLKKNLNH